MKPLKFVVFRDNENGIWITTPKHEQKALEEMENCGITTFDREEYFPEHCLLIDGSINLDITD